VHAPSLPRDAGEPVLSDPAQRGAGPERPGSEPLLLDPPEALDLLSGCLCAPPAATPPSAVSSSAAWSKPSEAAGAAAFRGRPLFPGLFSSSPPAACVRPLCREAAGALGRPLLFFMVGSKADSSAANQEEGALLPVPLWTRRRQ